MSFVVDSRPSFVSATTSSTVQVRNMFVYAKLTPLILFLNKIYAWGLNMRVRLCVCFNSTFRLQRFCVAIKGGATVTQHKTRFSMQFLSDTAGDI
jgi:hypothetical protein